MPRVPSTSGFMVSARRGAAGTVVCAVGAVLSATSVHATRSVSVNFIDGVADCIECGDVVTRPLLIIFLTIFVNLVGFGIIIPLLPYYAETFGASPVVVGLLFAVFSLCQLVAAPVLGDLSDRLGRRPILIFSLAGTVVSFVMLALAHSVTMLFAARIVDGLSGGNISTARAYVADITEPKDRARAYGLIGAAFGLGFILGPALSGILSHVSYTAPIWAAAGVTLVATLMAWLWLPETVHRARAGSGNPLRYLPALVRRPVVRRVLAIDFVYWCAFAIFQTTFALFAARRFDFDVARTGYMFAAFGVLGAVIQGGLIRPVVRRLGDKTTFRIGLAFGAVGLAGAALAHSVTMFVLALVPLALGIGFGHPTMASLVSLAAAGDEQGRVQGAASAVESLGRTVGPIWGNSSLQHLGESAPYMSAAVLIVMTLLLSVGFQIEDSHVAPISPSG
jgi:DHA1 family tetracycline resistance protein-like MFS transporter